MDVNDTVHTVRLRFDVKMQSHSEKIVPCERALRQFTRWDCDCDLFISTNRFIAFSVILTPLNPVQSIY